jgi:uncharacterized PurR-regulated membrane protein YhhQ (DUF165 family)
MLIIKLSWWVLLTSTIIIIALLSMNKFVAYSFDRPSFGLFGSAVMLFMIFVIQDIYHRVKK